jgi:predicted DNA-binding mobile mystery protein A
VKRKILTITDDMALARLSEAQDDTGIEPPHSEWILILRTYLRMTQAELAKRAGLPQSQIADIEGGKVNPQVRTLKRIFEALSCDLVIAPKPKKPLDEILRERARAIALKRLKQSMGTMALEGQAPDREVFLKLLEKRTDEILNDRREKLWNKKDE